VTEVYDGTTFADFVKSEQEHAAESLTYCI
jgi:hypothetical protein